MSTWQELVGFAALAGWFWIAWWLLGRAAERAGTNRLGFIGVVTLLSALFWR